MRNKLILASLITAFIVTLNGCYGDRTSNTTEKRKNVEFIVKMRGGDYWNSVFMGAHEAAKEFNVNMSFTAADSEHDLEKQRQIFIEAMDRKADAIVLAASYYNKMDDLIDIANEKKIPVITVDSGVSSNKVASKVSTDNFEAGKMAGERLASLVGDNANVAIVSFVKGSENADRREEGILSTLANSRNIQVVSKQYSYSSEKYAYNITKIILQTYNNIDGIAALNSVAALGAAQAIEELGLVGKVKLIAFDNTPLEVQYLENGVIQALVVQNPFAMGYLALKQAALASRQQDIEKGINIESRIIDKSNIYSEENQKFIFPFVK